MSVAAPEKPAAAAEAAEAVAALAEAITPQTREQLIEVMEHERKEFRDWMTLVYQSAVDYQNGTHQLKGGQQVCLHGFIRWLGDCGLPQPRDKQYGIPDREAKVCIMGDSEVPLSYLTVAGLQARRKAWQDAWGKQRQQVREGIISGVGQAHGNFPKTYRDDALKLLGLEPVQRVARVQLYVNMNYTLNKTRVSDKEITDKLTAALKEIIGDAKLKSDIKDYLQVAHEYVEEG